MIGANTQPQGAQAPVFSAGPGVAGLFRDLAVEIERDDPAHHFPLPFADFYRSSWSTLEPGTELLESWSGDLVIDAWEKALTLMLSGHFVLLIVNGPPRCGKSIPSSICAPAWIWTKFPGMRFILASHAGRSGLAKTLSHARRLLMKSEWFKERWADRFQFLEDQDEKMIYENDKRGRMQAVGVGGSITGEGGDIIIVDDAIDPKKANSETERKSAISWVTKVLYPRLNSKRKGIFAIIEQRTHVQDVTGTMLEKVGELAGVKVIHVNLPAIAEDRTVVEFPHSGRKVVRKEGSALIPEREGLQELEVSRATLGSRSFKAQYGQNPQEDTGEIVARSWWEWFDEEPEDDVAIWSWDTGLKATAKNAYTVGQLWTKTKGAHEFNMIRQIRERLEFPELLKAIERAFRSRRTIAVLVEDKASGISAIQTFKRNKRIPIISVPVDTDKITRWKNASPMIEAGAVRLPAGEKFALDYVDRWTKPFPGPVLVDERDATSQALFWFEKRFGGAGKVKALGAKKYAQAKGEKDNPKKEIARRRIRAR